MKNFRGFTMLELLVAMSLLATLGLFLVQLVSGSFDLYNKGDERGDLYANAVPILEMLEQDLLGVHSGSDGRFVLETDVLGGGRGRGDGFLLRIVRGIPHGESSHSVLRRAGTTIGAQESFSGEDPGPEKRGAIAPPSGIIEVAYALIAEPSDEASRPGILTLYRGERAPALAAGGFFDPARDGERDEAWVRANLRPVATDVLGLWILCFGQTTDQWDEDVVLDGRGAQNASFMVWDSTRGILPQSRFALARGDSSRNDPRDDIYPREVRVILEVGRGTRPDAVLRTAFRPDDQVLRVNNTRSLPNPDGDDESYIKIGSEWLLVIGKDRSDCDVQRNRRHTVSVQITQPPGTPVFAGRTFRKTMALPARRSFWVEPGR